MVCDLEGGERLRARDQGGGGYGTPAERETHRVLNDVAERYISADTARAVYGVAITGSIEDDSLAVDEVATRELRASMNGGGAPA